MNKIAIAAISMVAIFLFALRLDRMESKIDDLNYAIIGSGERIVAEFYRYRGD